MDTLTAPGTVGGTALRLALTDGSPSLTTEGPYIGRQNAVLLRPDWLLPLAAWFAGEAQPGITGHGEYGDPQGRWLAVAGDDAAIVYGARSWARLECLTPYGGARVSVGPRGRMYGTAVLLPPEGRQNAAAWLRRTNAENRARRQPAA